MPPARGCGRLPSRCRGERSDRPEPFPEPAAAGTPAPKLQLPAEVREVGGSGGLHPCFLLSVSTGDMSPSELRGCHLCFSSLPSVTGGFPEALRTRRLLLTLGSFVLPSLGSYVALQPPPSLRPRAATAPAAAGFGERRERSRPAGTPEELVALPARAEGAVPTQAPPVPLEPVACPRCPVSPLPSAIAAPLRRSGARDPAGRELA